jgi:hypothetical protein
MRYQPDRDRGWRSWLITTAKREAWRLHRKEAAHIGFEVGGTDDRVREPVEPDDTLAIRADLRAALDLLAAVPERRRQAKALQVMGYSLDEIGQLLGFGRTRANALVAEANVAMRREHLRVAPEQQPRGASSVTMAGSSPFIVYRDRIVAVTGATRCYFNVERLDTPSIRFVMAMCLCKREVDEGRLTGPFTSALAEQWARLLLIGPSNVATGLSDAELAEELCVPVDHVALARAELGPARQAFG